MLNSNEISTGTNFLEENEEGIRKPYHKPILEVLGDLRALTLGGSVGMCDSGIGDPHLPIGPSPC